MGTQVAATAKTGVGSVGVYVGAADIELVRQLRSRAGRVTLSGRAGLVLARALASKDDLKDVDLDPAGYRRPAGPQLELFAEDWAPVQRDLGLPIVRSMGHHVRRNDLDSLREAMSKAIGRDVVRVISLHESWLRPTSFPRLAAAVKACDDALAFVFASVMDPFGSRAATDALSELMQLASTGGRPTELLRTDLAAVAVASEAPVHGAIGLTTSIRHDALPFGTKQAHEYQQRQHWPLVYVPDLASWQRGSTLGALSAYEGAGLTNCSCGPCDGRSLLRFDVHWTDRAPVEVLEDARAHDVASWSVLAGRVLSSPNPARVWASVCADAVALTGCIASQYKVMLVLPRSITAWAGRRA